MSTDIGALIAQIRELEDRVATELAARRADADYALHKKRVVFEEAIRERHRQFRMGLGKFLRTSPFLTLLTAPVIYTLIVPLAFLDLCVTIYQWICFSAWGVPKARRSDYVVIDRQYLAYLNAIEKLNCVFCGYGNGVIAFAQEVASRTEQYWCPIKHAREAKGEHKRMFEFIDYGDAEGWHRHLDEMRRKIK